MVISSPWSSPGRRAADGPSGSNASSRPLPTATRPIPGGCPDRYRSSAAVLRGECPRREQRRPPRSGRVELATDRGDELRQAAVALDALEALLGFGEAGGGPTAGMVFTALIWPALRFGPTQWSRPSRVRASPRRAQRSGAGWRELHDNRTEQPAPLGRRRRRPTGGTPPALPPRRGASSRVAAAALPTSSPLKVVRGGRINGDVERLPPIRSAVSSNSSAPASTASTVR
jgi:hypothetical protein